MATLRWSTVRPLVQRLAPHSVLEVGCGQGSFGARLAATRLYVGVEPDERSCSVARARIAPLGGTVHQGMLHDAPLDQTFDLVCAFEVLEHIEDDVAALKEWATHVRPGGSVVLSVPAWPDRFGPMDAMVGHFRRYTEASLREVMEQAGFVDVRTSLYGWPLAYVLEAGRNAIANRRHDTAAATMEERSAGSGRLFQPAALVGTLVRVATLPFVFLQRLQSRRGTGLVAVGRLP